MMINVNVYKDVDTPCILNFTFQNEQAIRQDDYLGYVHYITERAVHLNEL